MYPHAPPNPGVHADKAFRLNRLDIDGVWAVEHSQMAGEAGLLHQAAHDGQSHSAHIQTAQGSPAEAKDLQSHAVLPGLRIPRQIALSLQRAQDVAGRTLWNVQFAADFAVA